MVLDYIDVLAWPVVVAVALASMFLMYRRHIERLIDRISLVKFPGGEAHMDPTDQPVPSDPVDSEVRRALVHEWTKVLDTDEFDAEGASDFEDAESTADSRNVEELENELAATRTMLEFERIYVAIFGSQVRALKALAETPLGLPAATLEPFVSEANATLPSSVQLQFAPWATFLAIAGLAEKIGEHYMITEKGRAFLAYIEATKRPDKGL